MWHGLILELCQNRTVISLSKRELIFLHLHTPLLPAIVPVISQHLNWIFWRWFWRGWDKAPPLEGNLPTPSSCSVLFSTVFLFFLLQALLSFHVPLPSRGLRRRTSSSYDCKLPSSAVTLQHLLWAGLTAQGSSWNVTGRHPRPSSVTCTDSLLSCLEMALTVIRVYTRGQKECPLGSFPPPHPFRLAFGSDPHLWYTFWILVFVDFQLLFSQCSSKGFAHTKLLTSA